jgi:AraC family transcriptional regulator
MKAADQDVDPWKAVTGECRVLFGSFAALGWTVEWHDFESDTVTDWGRSFHRGSLEICVNFSGCGSIGAGRRRHVINPQTLSHYRADPRLTPADRHPVQRHRFLTVEMSSAWLGASLSGSESALRPEVVSFLGGKRHVVSAHSQPLPPMIRQRAEEMLRPPVTGPAAQLWFQARTLELIAESLFRKERSELFCQRQHRLARERVERVQQILGRDIEHPPPLAELGREAGCSPFYLSRIFSQQMGMTISQYLRKLRMEKAADLLQSGRFNVTEAALAVGYSSLSHFSKAFSETFGTCPCLYPHGRRGARGLRTDPSRSKSTCATHS